MHTAADTIYAGLGNIFPRRRIRKNAGLGNTFLISRIRENAGLGNIFLDAGSGKTPD